jgi:putative hemolysin
MISNIIELDEKKAGDIMTHRKNIVAVDGDTSLEEAVNYMLHANNSRFPVYIEDIDTIIGIIHLRDAVRCLHMKGFKEYLVKDIPAILREAKFIPETKNINALFREMQSEKIQMEIVVDEYGQTAGIVAMEDILEEIVGNIMDEYDIEDNNIVKQSENVYLVKGMTTLEQLEDELGMEFSEEEYDTFNGYLISKLDRIPSEEDNEVIYEAPYKYEIMAVENNIITLVRLSIEELTEPLNEEVIEEDKE